MLELSQVKVSDEGLRVLLYYSLGHLMELDLSSTQVTPTGLKLLPAGERVGVACGGVYAIHVIRRSSAIRETELGVHTS